MTLQEWMDLKDLKDAGLERELNKALSRSQISRIRRGVSKPSLEKARLLERHTKIPAAAFLTGEAA